MKVIETERLIIRPFTMDDLDEIYRLVYADTVVKNAWSGRAGTPDEIKAAFAANHVQRTDDFGKAVVRKEDDRLIGLMGFQRYEVGEDTSFIVFEHEPNRLGQDPNLIEAELTYAFGRAYWGHGYATEAGRALIEYGFGEMGVGRIVNDVNSENLHSVNLMRRLGFRLQRNLNPKPFINSDAPAMIGALDNDRFRYGREARLQPGNPR